MSKFKFNWGYGLMLGLLAFIVFILTLIFSADVSGDLVSDDYYETSLHYQEDNIDARNRASLLKEKPLIKKQANGFSIEFPKSIVPDSGQIYLMRGAFKSDDILINLQLDNRQKMLIPAAKMKSGEYDMRLTWYIQDKIYLIKRTIRWNMD